MTTGGKPPSACSPGSRARDNQPTTQPTTRPYRFLTFWAFACHFLFLLNLLPNTFALAATVFVLSRVHLIFDPDIPLPLDFVFHWLPILIIPATQWNWALVAVVVAAYLLVNNGPLDVLRFHTDARKYFHG